MLARIATTYAPHASTSPETALISFNVALSTSDETRRVSDADGSHRKQAITFPKLVTLNSYSASLVKAKHTRLQPSGALKKVEARMIVMMATTWMCQLALRTSLLREVVALSHETHPRHKWREAKKGRLRGESGVEQCRSIPACANDSALKGPYDYESGDGDDEMRGWFQSRADRTM